MTTKVKFKNKDNMHEHRKLIPLISDINDKRGVLIEHLALNEKYKNLKYALIKINNNYYFINADDAVIESKKSSDNNLIMCPFCKQDLASMYGYKYNKNGKEITVPSHFKHYENNIDCLFKNVFKSDFVDITKKKYIGEQYNHKFLKLTTCALANAGVLSFNIPKSYELIIDKENYTCKVEFTFETERVISAETETKVLKKDEHSKGLVPDLIFYTESGNRILCEVTDASGKTVREYYDRWNRVNNTVLELKMVDNKHIYENPFYDKETGLLNIDKFSISDYKFNDKRIFTFLYSPLLDKARRECNIMKAKLADLEKENILKMNIDELKIQIKNLSEEKNILSNEICFLNMNKEYLESNVKALRVESEQLKTDIRNTSRRKSVEILNEIKEMKEKRNNLQYNIDEMYSIINSLNNELEKLDIKSKNHKKEITLLTQEISKLEREKKNMLKELSLIQSNTKNVVITNKPKNETKQHNSSDILTVSTLIDKLLSLKENNLYGFSGTVKCKFVKLDNGSRVLLYDDNDDKVFIIDENLDISKLEDNKTQTVKIGIWIDSDTKRETITFFQTQK